MKKRKLWIILSLASVLTIIIYYLYHAQKQKVLQKGVDSEDAELSNRNVESKKTLQEEINSTDVKEAEEKELIHTGSPLQEVATGSKRKSKGRFIINIVWSCLMIWMIIVLVQTSLPWQIWSSIGLHATIFGIIYEIVISPILFIIYWTPVLIESSTWLYPAGRSILMEYLLNALLVAWYVWIAVKCVKMLIRTKS